MKKKLLIAGKVLLTAAVFAWVAYQLPGGPKHGGTMRDGLGKLWATICEARFPGLVLALLVLIGPTVLGIWRWRLLLRVQGIELSIYRATWITATGIFFNSFLLGATGGDVFKAWYAACAAPDKKTTAVLSVFVDRLIGMVGLFALASVVTLLNLPILLEHPQTCGLAWFVVGSLAAVVAVLALVTQRHRIKDYPAWQWVWQRLPAKGVFSQLAESWHLYEKQPGILLVAFLISLGVHLVSMLGMWCIGQALDIQNVRLVHYYVYGPIINTITAVPITPSGIGVREGLFQFFFGLQGVPGNQSVALSLIFYATMVTISLLCGLLFLLGKPRTWGFPEKAKADAEARG
jgi:uncharacterized membrane protein YbhN (UPF0104 family)